MGQENLSIYPFEVIYTDGTRSNHPQEGKTIWGVMFCNRGISLQSSPDILFDEAQKYCQGIKVGKRLAPAAIKAFGNSSFAKEKQKSQN